MSDIFAVLGRRIRQERQARGVTQQRLAELVGMDTGHLSRIERGKAVPSINVVKRIADALCLPIAQIFADIPPRKLSDDSGWGKKIGTMVRDLPARRRERVLRLFKMIVKSAR